MNVSRLAALAVGLSLLPACEPAAPTAPAEVPLVAAAAPAAGFRTTAPAQAEMLVPGELIPLATAGDTMPGSGEVLVGIPDGIGSFGGRARQVSYLNHEISGAARVSRFVFNTADATIRKHRYVIDGSEGYNRLCSASWNSAKDGFRGGYFFTGEEASDGLQLAIDRAGNVTELPHIGYYAHEQQIAVPGFRGHTVVVNFDDDGTSGPNMSTRDGESELYMYVARNPNGVLRGRGQLYVFTSSSTDHVGRLDPGDQIEGYWIPVPEAVALDRGPDPVTGKPPLDEWVDDPAHDAFDFTRLEDGFYDKVAARARDLPAIYIFDTGDPTLGTDEIWDYWGSIYRMEWQDRRDPAGKTTFTLLARSNGPGTGWASPDNGDMNEQGVIMLQEDPAADPWTQDEARIWSFQRAAGGGLSDPTGTLIAQTLGSDCLEDSGGECWETSGIEDASKWYGDNAWIFDVQSKEPLATCPECVTNGQLLIMKVGGKFNLKNLEK